MYEKNPLASDEDEEDNEDDEVEVKPRKARKESKRADDDEEEGSVVQMSCRVKYLFRVGKRCKGRVRF